VHSEQNETATAVTPVGTLTVSASSQRTRPPTPPGAASIAGLCSLVGALAIGGTPAMTGTPPDAQRASAVARATASQPVEIEVRRATHALDAGLAGNTIAITQTQPDGCDVKY
jgi:hypothetical protein